VTGPPKQLLVTAQDASVGLQSVSVVESDNTTISIPAIATYTYTPVTVTPTKVDQRQSSDFTLQVTNMEGISAIYDPVNFTLLEENRTAIHTFRRLKAIERYIRIDNGEPGIRKMTFLANGSRFPVRTVGSGQTIMINVGSAMRVGDNNVVTLEGIGPRGASASILIGDASVL
jgi:hypothetical protein